jgi:hypothetical protein
MLPKNYRVRPVTILTWLLAIGVIWLNGLPISAIARVAAAPAPSVAQAPAAEYPKQLFSTGKNSGGKPQASLSPAGGLSQAVSTNRRGRAGANDPLAAQAWFYGQRAMPGQTIPISALNRAFQQRSQIPSTPATNANNFVLSSVNPLSPTWAALGPAPTSVADPVNIGPYGYVTGRITALAYDATSSGTLYAGSAEGGLWKSTNGGATWLPLLDSQLSLAVGALALDPSNPQTIYVATGEANYYLDSYYSVGILKSTNGGASWSRLGQSTFGGNLTGNTKGTHIAKVAVDPNNTSHLLVAADSGLWLSTDGGTTWNRQLGSASDGTSAITDLAIDSATNPSTVYASWGYYGGNSANGIYKSTSGGSSFSKLTLPASASDGTTLGRLTLALAPSDHNRLYLMAAAPVPTGAQSPSLGVWTTSNGGTSWQQVSAAFTGIAGSGPDLLGDDTGVLPSTEHGTYSMVLAVDPAISTTVYAGGINLFKSTDGGQNFTDITNVYVTSNPTPHPDQHALIFYGSASPRAFYLGNDGGVFGSTNGGTNWLNNNGNLAITHFYAGATTKDFTATPVVWGGAQGNGTQKYSGVVTWTETLGGNGGYTAIDPNNSSTVYGEQAYLNIYKSTDGGVNWNPATGGINVAERSLYVAPFVMDTTNPQRLLAGTDHLYETLDGAQSWHALSTFSLAADNSQPFGAISAIGVAPSLTSTIYVGTGDGKLWRTANNGLAWTEITTGTVGTSGRYVTQLSVYPTDPQDVVVSFSGFANATGTGSGTHLYRSLDGGTAWTDISTGLPDSPANSVLRNPTHANVLYLGSDTGFFYTLNSNSGAATTWTQYQGGLPNVVIDQLFTDANFTTFVAATHGRSMFTLATASVPTGDCDPLTVTSNTDNGTGATCGTLSYAINQAKTAIQPVAITFSATAVTLTGPLPTISNTSGVTVTITGGCSSVNGRGVPGVHLSAGSGAGAVGLTLNSKIVVNGLGITGFSSYAIDVQGDNNQLTCNWLGTADGLTAAANGGGVRLGTVGGLAANNNFLGLAGLAESGNLISGNSGHGVLVNKGTGNKAYYNYIGYQKDGVSLLKNGNAALFVVSGGQLILGVGNRLHN